MGWYLGKFLPGPIDVVVRLDSVSAEDKILATTTPIVAQTYFVPAGPELPSNLFIAEHAAAYAVRTGQRHPDLLGIPDIVVAFNARWLSPAEFDSKYYLDVSPFDGITSSGRIDFFTLLLHELMHGFGFVSLRQDLPGKFGEFSSRQKRLMG